MSIMNYHDELLVQFTRGAELVNRPGVSPARTRIYPGNDKPSVDDLNLDIKDGEFLVLAPPVRPYNRQYDS